MGELVYLMKFPLNIHIINILNSNAQPGQDPLVLCFVDFVTPAQAAVALEALQGEQKC